jgi:hypothetical protein
VACYRVAFTFTSFDVTPCSVVEIYRLCGGTCCCHYILCWIYRLRVLTNLPDFLPINARRHEPGRCSVVKISVGTEAGFAMERRMTHAVCATLSDVITLLLVRAWSRRMEAAVYIWYRAQVLPASSSLMLVVVLSAGKFHLTLGQFWLCFSVECVLDPPILNVITILTVDL